MRRNVVFAITMVVVFLSAPFMGLFGEESEILYCSANVDIAPIEGTVDVDYKKVVDLNAASSDELFDTIDQIDDDVVLFAGSEVLCTVVQTEPLVMENMIKSGVPLVIEGDPKDLQSLSVSSVVNYNANYSAFYYDPVARMTYCYGIESSEPDAKAKAISWVETVRSSASVQSSDTDYNNAVFYHETKDCGGGKATINATAFYSLLGVSNGYKYYSVEYRVEGITEDASWHVADITTICDVDGKNSLMKLIDYSPDDTPGEKSTTVGVSLSLGAGFGISFSKSWSYTIPATVVRNESNSAEDYFKIWNDIDQDVVKEYDMNHIRVRPGMIVAVSTASSYYAEDEHEVRFKKPYYEKLWPWDPDTEIKGFTLTCSAFLT